MTKFIGVAYARNTGIRTRRGIGNILEKKGVYIKNKMAKITMDDLVENFKKAIIIDIDKKSVWVVKDGKVKVYPKKYYKEILSGLNFMDFGENGN